MVVALVNRDGVLEWDSSFEELAVAANHTVNRRDYADSDGNVPAAMARKLAEAWGGLDYQVLVQPEIEE